MVCLGARRFEKPRNGLSPFSSLGVVEIALMREVRHICELYLRLSDLIDLCIIHNSLYRFCFICVLCYLIILQFRVLQ